MVDRGSSQPPLKNSFTWFVDVSYVLGQLYLINAVVMRAAPSTPTGELTNWGLDCSGDGKGPLTDQGDHGPVKSLCSANAKTFSFTRDHRPWTPLMALPSESIIGSCSPCGPQTGSESACGRDGKRRWAKVRGKLENRRKNNDGKQGMGGERRETVPRHKMLDWPLSDCDERWWYNREHDLMKS